MPDSHATVKRGMIFLVIRLAFLHTTPMAIERGSLVDATTAGGERVVLRALGGPVKGRDFPVVWVCTEEEWQRSEREGNEADGLPWPLDAVTELEPA